LLYIKVKSYKDLRRLYKRKEIERKGLIKEDYKFIKEERKFK
jgi:hypothetical protein